MSFAEAARIGALTIVLMLGDLRLLWAQRGLVGSLVLLLVFAIGLVIESLEHFFIPGPNGHMIRVIPRALIIPILFLSRVVISRSY